MPAPDVVVSDELAPMVVDPEPALVLPVVVEPVLEPAPCAVVEPEAPVSEVPLVPAVVEPVVPAPAAVPVVPVVPEVPAAVLPVADVPAVPLVPVADVPDVPAVPLVVPPCDQARPTLPANAAATTVSVNFFWIDFMGGSLWWWVKSKRRLMSAAAGAAAAAERTQHGSTIFPMQHMKPCGNTTRAPVGVR